MAELSFYNIFFCFFVFFSFLLCWLQCTLSTTMLKKGGTRVYTLFILLRLHRRKGVLEGVDVGILWSYVMVVTGVPGGKPLTLDRWPLPCHKWTSGIEPELQQWQARFSPPALSTPLKKGSHLIKILQAIVFIWLHTCLPFTLINLPEVCSTMWAMAGRLMYWYLVLHTANTLHSVRTLT